MSAPTQIRAGDSVAWSETLDGYPPADGWSLKYRLLWPSGSSVENILATVSADQYQVSLSATATATWPAGYATLVSFVTRGVERVTLEQRLVEVLPNLETATVFDGRSQNQRALSDAKAALAAYMASGRMHVAEYDIAGRSMKFRTPEEIRALIEYYEAECAKERAALAILSGGSPGRVLTRF
jgi:hypothetical protein